MADNDMASKLLLGDSKGEVLPRALFGDLWAHATNLPNKEFLYSRLAILVVWNTIDPYRSASTSIGKGRF